MGFFTKVSNKAKKLTGDISEWQKKREIERNRQVLKEYEQEKQRAKIRSVQLKTERLKQKHRPTCNHVPQSLFGSQKPSITVPQGFFGVDDARPRPRKKNVLPKKPGCLHSWDWLREHRMYRCRFCGKLKQWRVK